MKQKIITAGIIAVIATVAFLNVNVVLKSEKSNSLADITLGNAEALADTEWNDILDWLKYGLRKDERIRTTSCSQTNTSSQTSTTTSPSGTVDMIIYVNGKPVKVKVSTGGKTTTDNNNSTTYVPNGKRKTCETGGTVNCDACDCC